MTKCLCLNLLNCSILVCFCLKNFVLHPTHFPKTGLKSTLWPEKGFLTPNPRYQNAALLTFMKKNWLRLEIKT